MRQPILYIIVPCYNEEQVLPITSKMFLEEIMTLIEKNKISDESRIVFVNDGSKDKTWNIIYELTKNNKYFEGICLSRNYGHQNAVLAGLMESKDQCDITISIDCDGQDDITSMEKMVDEYKNGCEVVYGVRASRDKDTLFKRISAKGFYKLLGKLGTEVLYNHADYRLISSKALKEFADFKEVNLFLRGLIPLIGFKSTSVYYDRQKRIDGKSQYSLRDMMALALDGITSFSVKPIKMITNLGIIVSLISFIGVIRSLLAYMMGMKVEVWISMASIICFLGGIQLIALGIIGIYIGKIYMEVKQRPRYIISERTKEKKDEK